VAAEAVLVVVAVADQPEMVIAGSLIVAEAVVAQHLTVAGADETTELSAGLVSSENTGVLQRVLVGRKTAY
jgi:hypothetical protein